MATVADAVGITHPVISLIENGKYSSLKLIMLHKICDYLKIPIDEVLRP